MNTVTATMVGISECSSENGVFFYTIQVRHFLVGHIIYISLRGSEVIGRATTVLNISKYAGVLYVTVPFGSSLSVFSPSNSPKKLLKQT